MDPFERGVAKAQAAQDATEAEQARAARVSKMTIDRLFALLSPKIAEIGYEIWVEGGTIFISKWREEYPLAQADLYLRASHLDFSLATLHTPDQGGFHYQYLTHPLNVGRSPLTDDQILEVVGIYYASTRSQKAEGDERRRRFAIVDAENAAEARAKAQRTLDASTKRQEEARKQELADRFMPWVFGLGLLFAVIYFVN